MNESITKTHLPMDQVVGAISDYFGGACVRLDGPISVRDNSEVYHATVEKSHLMEVAIKVCLIPFSKNRDKIAAQEQFEALDQVSQVMSDPSSRFRVPEPLCLLSEQGTYVMSWIDGESLTQKMRNLNAVFGSPTWFEDVGAWLGRFHSAGQAHCQPVVLDDRIEVLDELCASPMHHRSFLNAAMILQQTLSTVDSTGATHAWLHGDCKTDNFFFTGSKVYGIDIGLKYINPVEYDLAQFLNNLELNLASLRNVHLRVMRQRLEKAFLRGYESCGPAISFNYLNWLRLNFLLSFWHSLLNGQKNSARTWVLNRRFGTVAGHLSDRILQGLN